jgi:hypothetical protein
MLMLGASRMSSRATALAQSSSNAPPRIAITNPPTSSVFTYPAIIRLKTDANDVDGTIVEVRFYEQTNLLGMVRQAPYDLVLTNMFDVFHGAAYCYYASATDDRQATATSAPVKVTITQDPIPPRVSLTEPTNDAAFLWPASVSITAVVAAYDGSENPVQFFSGSDFIGNADTPLHTVPVTNPPVGLAPFVATYYSLTITNLAIGEHNLTAQYVDNRGNGGTSQEIRIRLTPVFLVGAILADGQFGFTIGGLQPGKDFQVEASSNLVTWTSIATNSASSNLFQFIDSATNQCRRFYRALQSL